MIDNNYLVDVEPCINELVQGRCYFKSNQQGFWKPVYLDLEPLISERLRSSIVD